MKNAFRALLVAATLLSTSAFATVVNFDASGTKGVYNGLDYAIDGYQFNATMDNIDISASSPWASSGAAKSGAFAGLNNWGGVGEITRVDGATFTFNSLWLKGWMNGMVTGTVVGLLNGVQVAEIAVSSSNVWTLVSGNFANIDMLRIDVSGFFLVDDINLNEPANVPEPASLMLVGLGLAGLYAAGRTARRQV